MLQIGKYTWLPNSKRTVVYQRPEACGTQEDFSSGSLARGAGINIVQYLGIAADEPKRIQRHTKPGILMPLVELGWDEAYCRSWCESRGLLSPIYSQATRGVGSVTTKTSKVLGGYTMSIQICGNCFSSGIPIARQPLRRVA